MCARAPVQVTTMPGFGAPLSNTYSGYVAAGAGKHHHVSLGFARLRAMWSGIRARSHSTRLRASARSMCTWSR